MVSLVYSTKILNILLDTISCETAVLSRAFLKNPKVCSLRMILKRMSLFCKKNRYGKALKVDLAALFIDNPILITKEGSLTE